jgi:hypothetical protein
MKQTAILDKVQQSMQPGVITRGGFLGSDTRHLVDILVDDDARVHRLGLTHEAIADRMEELRMAGARGLGEGISVPPHFLVRVDSVRGKLPCPFGHEGLYQKTNTTVRNEKLGRELTFTDLSTHMIRVHGFYEGHGGLFRLDPEELAAVLEIEPPEDTLPDAPPAPVA